ncbi:hypothetical protein Tco_1375267, partial [Tanacetum coccineum]
MMVNDFPIMPLDQWGWILMDRELWRISALSGQLQQECDSVVQQRHSIEEFLEWSSRG